jgi:DNA-binding transcriptional LysR family regulator
MAKLDLEWLVIFDEIYKIGNVSRAAERLGIAQAAASIALSKLRKYYGDPLFSRTSRGMQPTPRAESLYPDIRGALDRMAAAKNSVPVFHPRSVFRTFQICMTDISEIVMLPQLINYLASHAPGIRVAVEKISAGSPQRLEDGVIDLAVGFMPRLEAGFFQQVLFDQRFVSIVGRQHPRIAGRITRKQFERECHVVVTTSGTGHAIVDKVLKRQGIHREVKLEVPSFLGVARIVAETELIATVPLRYGQVMQDHEAIRVLRHPIDIPQYSVKQHWHERFHSDAANIWLRRLIATLFCVKPSDQLKANKT